MGLGYNLQWSMNFTQIGVSAESGLGLLRLLSTLNTYSQPHVCKNNLSLLEVSFGLSIVICWRRRSKYNPNVLKQTKISTKNPQKQTNHLCQNYSQETVGKRPTSFRNSC